MPGTGTRAGAFWRWAGFFGSHPAPSGREGAETWCSGRNEGKPGRRSAFFARVGVEVLPSLGLHANTASVSPPGDPGRRNSACLEIRPPGGHVEMKHAAFFSALMVSSFWMKSIAVGPYVEPHGAAGHGTNVLVEPSAVPQPGELNPCVAFRGRPAGPAPWPRSGQLCAVLC